MAKSKKASSNKKNQAGPRKGSDWLYLILIGLAFLIIYQYVYNPKINLGGDNAGYYILGKALAEGQGFTDIHKPHKPVHTHFPPGYPAVMSIFMQISDSIDFIKTVNGLFLLGATILLYFLLKEFTGDRRLAFAGSFLGLFNMHLLSYATIMMSEISFLFFTTLSFYLFVRSHQAQAFFKHPAFYGLIVTSVLSYHIRSIGIAMVVGLAIYLLFSKNFKYLLGYLAGFVLLSLPWYLYSQSVSKGGGYLASLMNANPYRPEEGKLDFMGFLERIWENLQRYLGKEIPNGLFPFIEVDYKADVLPQEIIVGVLILALIIIGLVRMKRYAMLLLWYLLGNFGIFMLWPEVWFGIRFMLPLIPLMLFLMSYGILQLLQILAQRLKIKAQPSPFLILLFLFLFIPQLKLLKASAESPMVPKYSNYFEVAQYVNHNLPAEAIVACRKPTLFYLYAQREVTKYRNEQDYTKLLNHLDTLGTTHIVIDQLGYSSTGRYLVPAIQANPLKFRNIYQVPKPDTYLITFNNKLGYRGDWKQRPQNDPNKMTLAVKEGNGTYRYSNGRVYKGQWKNNKRHGQGTLTFPDGRVQKGKWNNGNFVGDSTQTSQ